LLRVPQKIEDITSKLSSIQSAWEDSFSQEIEKGLHYLKKLLRGKKIFKQNLISELLNKNFTVYLSIFRFFLELSKDEFEGRLREFLPHGIGVTADSRKPKPFVDSLVDLGLVSSINRHLSKKWTWADFIIERLKLGRGSAIKGQQRGRYLEKEVEKIIKGIFGDLYDKNCNFTGLNQQEAKAEFAIPSRRDPAIVFEAKAYGATGSKQTDVIGDIEKIIRAKKHNTHFILITDGISWNQRLSDLRKIIKFQNDGFISKIDTLCMLPDLESDLRLLKQESGL
jgi:hypothetical protein